MKYIVLILVLACSILTWADESSSTLEAKGPKEIVFGFFPAGNPEKLKTEAMSFAQELQKRISVPVSVYVAKDYGSLTRALEAKKVDFAFLTPSVFVELEQKKQVKVLLKKVWNTDVYYSAIAVLANSKFKQLSDLNSTRMAFVDRSSTSGYLYPSRFLAKAGLSETRFRSVEFLGSHKSAVEALDQGRVDGIAIFADDPKAKVSALNHYGNTKNKYRILWVSESIPNDPLCVRMDFYEMYARITHDVMFALVEMAEENTKLNNWGEVLGARGLVPATSRHYDGVRNVIAMPKFELKK